MLAGKDPEAEVTVRVETEARATGVEVFVDGKRLASGEIIDESERTDKGTTGT